MTLRKAKYINITHIVNQFLKILKNLSTLVILKHVPTSMED